ncbi:hypothetical protein M885DRAFT_568700 [Pelagophyceae sp. CCMP2097]|nr:hypothetical protein M885DRAFT_568700 [Pelagophyceae sp. CCMP2097]
MSADVAACLRSARADFEAMAAISARMADACTSAVHVAALSDRGAETAAHCGSKRPSAASAGAVKLARRGRAHSSRFVGVSWSHDHGTWYATVNGADGIKVALGYFEFEEEAARAYDAAVYRMGLQHIRRGNSKKDGKLFAKPHLGYFAEEREAALAVDAYVRLAMPGTALNLPTLEELYSTKLKVPLQARLTYDAGGGRREVLEAKLTEVKYDPGHKSANAREIEADTRQTAIEARQAECDARAAADAGHIADLRARALQLGNVKAQLTKNARAAAASGRERNDNFMFPSQAHLRSIVHHVTNVATV